MKKINIKIKAGGFILFLLTSAYFFLLISPNILFAHHHNYKNFDVHSDLFIPNDIDKVLDDVIIRISHSELYDSTDSFAIYICNSSWRLLLFTRSADVGGLVNQGISNNVFIRESEIAKNRIISPTKGQEIALPEERPLSYFIAHEVTHALQTKLDRFMHLTTPKYIVEGYADYIGKATHFKYEKYLNNLNRGDITMNPETGLYNKYHLLIGYLMDKKGMTFREIIDKKFDMAQVEHWLESENATNKEK